MKQQKKNEKQAADDFYFDDCPVCRAMKEAQQRGRDMTPSEIAEAFGEAKKVGGIVGTIVNPDPASTRH